MPNTKQERNDIFDYAKGIGIILVVYAHVARGVFNAGLPINHDFYVLADRIIYSFHMPLFFFISGYFLLKSLAKRSAVQLIGNKAGTVLYPYLVWSLLQGIVEVALAKYTNGHVQLKDIFTLLWQPRAQFWFLYVLFGVFTMAALLYRNPSPPWTSLVLGLAILYFLGGYSPVDVYMLNAMPNFFVYFAFGVSFSHILPKLNLSRYSWLISLAALFAIGQWGIIQDLTLLSINLLPISKLVLGMLGITLTLSVSQYLSKLKWSFLSFLGRYSLEIYLMHIFFSSGIRILLYKNAGVTDPTLHLLLGTLLGVAIPPLVAIYARRLGWTWLFSIKPRSLTPVNVQN